jgi:hypothetical protein
MAEGFGKGGVENLHPLLEPQIRAWINEIEIPEFICGHWSLNDIRNGLIASFAIIYTENKYRQRVDNGSIKCYN